jgi:hypothetical protein
LTPDSVLVTVNPESLDPGCRCWVGPGERQLIGYYVFDESIVRVSNAERFAIYRDLERLVDPISGAVEIRVDSASFHSGR